MWTIPVLSPEPPRRLLGVKTHRQNPPEGMKKGGWLVKGGTGLFPLLEAFDLPAGGKIILAPGELKALAYVSAGIPATSITTGENTSLTSWRSLAPRFTRLVVKIDSDRDQSRASTDFINNATTALLPVASFVEVCV